ncbi:mitochondrial matrix Mmp37 [Naematelia encephala]|uniref:Phosphatidate cytidylyltransferase, mitochondrial n=1 Tax=Naematelia encephala TaxID=71784 RepID=A0A1Y2B6R6_9TREE|nr:mitochondrial matrix Mmp37 [Naematelia encephala]
MSRQPLCQACLRAAKHNDGLLSFNHLSLRLVVPSSRAYSTASRPIRRKDTRERELWTTCTRWQSTSTRRLTPIPAQEKAYARLRPIIDALPGSVDWAVAYGSGVIHQANASPDQPAPMTDFLLSTPSPSQFHTANLRQNPSHYPLYARFLGGRGVAWLQDSLGAGVWYVTMVHINGLEVKYGVISSDRLKKDLEEWETLYVAGRLQKPVLPLLTPPELVSSIHKNLISTVSLSLLLLPPGPFSELLLWETIAGISYSGDPRMSVPGAENPEKVKNIVRGEGSLEGFRRLYQDVMIEFKERGLAWAEDGDKSETTSDWDWRGRGRGERLLKQPESPSHTAHLLSLLPSHLQRNLLKHFRPTIAGSMVDRDVRAARKEAKAKAQDQEQEQDKIEIWDKVAREERLREMVLNEVRQIIRRPALTQSIKGILTAGLVKGVKYAWAKFGKWLAGRRKR